MPRQFIRITVQCRNSICAEGYRGALRDRKGNSGVQSIMERYRWKERFPMAMYFCSLCAESHFRKKKSSEFYSGFFSLWKWQYFMDPLIAVA